MKWMFGVSVAWLAIGGAILFQSSLGCDDGATKTVFSCLAANELGDFLAGFFAPLAFAWLAYAVVIQSKELAAQKEELRLTREDMKLTREVAIEAKDATRAQAEEARKSAELFSMQTKLMEEEHQREMQARAHNEFDHLVKSLSQTLLGAANQLTPERMMIVGRSDGVPGFRASLDRCNAILSQLQNIDTPPVTEKQLRGIETATHVSRAFADLFPKLSAVDRIVYKDWGIDTLNVLVELCTPTNLGAK